MREARFNDIERRLSMVGRAGTVVDVDYAAARVKLKVGGNTTPWIPWETSSAGSVRVWNPPRMGEQRIVNAPAGDLAAAYCGAALFKDSAPANGGADDGGKFIASLPEGATITYDTDANALNADLSASGAATIKIGAAQFAMSDSGVTITVGGVTVAIDGSGLTVSGGDVKADSVSLKTHKHGGVQSGGSQTGPPAA